MGTKRNYSLTKDKYRFNDDFLTEIIGFGNVNTGQFTGKKLDSLHYFPEITSIDDWSVSFFTVLNTAGNNNIIFDTRQVFGSVDGVVILIKDDSVIILTGLSPSVTVTMNYNFPLNSLIHVVLTYDSLTQTLDLFYNNRKIKEGVSFVTTFDNKQLNKSAFGRFALGNLVPANFMLRDLATFNKKLNESEVNYVYQTGYLPNTSHESCMFHAPFNNIANKSNNGRIRKTIDTESWNDNKTYFNFILSIGDEFEFTNKTSNANGNPQTTSFQMGLTDGIGLDTTSDNYYLFLKGKFTSNARKTGGVNVGSSIPIVYNDTYKMVIKSFTEVEFYVNNVFQTSIIDADLTNFRFFISVLDPNQSPASELKRNGLVITNDISLIDSNTGIQLNDNVSMNIVANYNYAKTVPILKDDIHHLGFAGFSDEEIGLAPVSDFTAFPDFYTRNNGENFTGGGDSINYKTKELRKFGIRLDGTQYFSILNLTQFDTNKGLTILVGVADINLIGSVKEFIHLTDSNTNRVITLEYDDVSTQILFKSGDVTQDTQSISIDKTGSNFAVYRVSQDVNKYSDGGLFRKSSNINTGENTLTNQNLNRTDATYNVYIGSGNTGLNALDCVITYFAMFEGILNDAEVKPYFNNGIFSNVSDLSQTTKSTLIVACDFNNPFDDLGVLKIPDLSASNEEIVVNGFANITDLENAKEEILSLI